MQAPHSRRPSATPGVLLAALGAAVALSATWMVFAWAPIEATQGVIQRIHYVHIPVAGLAELAFGMTALFGVAYLWLRDDRADATAVAAAEGGLRSTSRSST